MSQYPPPPPPPYAPPPRNHPQATTILVLGICGLVLCQVLGPFAWVMGTRALREIDASHGQLGGRDTVNIGRILGIIGTVLMVLGLVLFLGLFVVGGIVATTSTSP